MAIDPICGMEVDEKDAKFKAEKDGRTYYFCSQHCLDAFLEKGRNAQSVLRNVDKPLRKTEKLKFSIGGMSCAACVAAIENGLRSFKGVVSANVNFATEKATVEYDPATTDIEKIKAVVRATGYEVVEPKPSEENVLKLKVIGMDNPHCVGIIEGALENLAGVLSYDLKVNEKAAVKFDPKKVTPRVIMDVIREAGYTPIEEKEATEDAERAAREKEIASLRNRFIGSFVLCLPLVYYMLHMLFGLPLPEFMMKNAAAIELALTTPILFLGSIFFTRGLISLTKTRTANMDTLVSMGVGTAYIYSFYVSVGIWSGRTGLGMNDLYYEVAGFLITFILLGKYFEARAKGRTSEAIRRLIGLRPKTATVVRGGKEIEIGIDEVAVGDVVLVKPGGKIPVDGEVIDGRSYVDESMVSGESLPVEKSPGSKVIGTTILKTGSLRIKAEKIGQDTFLAHIIKLVEDAQGSKAPVEELADRISAVFVPGVLLAAVLTFIAWIIFSGNFIFALNAFIAVLIIACPCALGLATPTAVMVGTGIGAERGILIKNAEALQLASSVDTVVFDKTGTLTNGKPEVTDIVELNSGSELLLHAAIAEKNSEHPLAEAVLARAAAEKLSLPNTESFEALPGRGVKALFMSEEILLGNRKLFNEAGIPLEKFEGTLVRLESQGKTAVIVSKGKTVLGAIGIADTLKESAKEAVAKLRKMGKGVVMLSGDNRHTAAAIADQAGISEVLAEVMPQDKSLKIYEIQQEGKKVAMVGDGINDAPALAQADVGIAIGSGTDVAIETGEIVLVRDDLRDVVTAIELSAYAMRKIKQNLFWAFVYNTLGIPIAAGILYPFTGFLLSPIIAGAAMAFSSVSVVTNSLLMRRFKN